MSFLFQSEGRIQELRGLSPRYMGALFATQLALLSPSLLIAFLGVFPRFWNVVCRPGRIGARATFLFAFFAPLFVLFVASSSVRLIKPNWLWPAYVSGLLLAIRWMSARLIRWHFVFTAIVHVVLVVELFAYPIPIESDDTWIGWSDLAAKLEARIHPDEFVFSADEYKTSAELRFYLRRPVYGPNLIGAQGFEFSYLEEDLRTLVGKNALFVDSAPHDRSPEKSGSIPSSLLENFETVDEIEPVLVTRGHNIVRKFYLYRCVRFRTLAR